MPIDRWFCEYAWLGELHADVVIEVEGETIVGIHPGVTPPVDAIRLAGMTIPGLANAHSHAFHRVLRGLNHHAANGFWSWREMMYEVAGRLEPDSYRRLARAVYTEMVMAGITAVGEFHYLHHQIDGSPYSDPNEMAGVLTDAAAEAGIRLTLLDALYLSSGFGQPVEGVQRRFSDGSAEAWIARVEGLNLGSDVRVGAAIHSVRAVDQKAAETVAAWANKNGVPLHFHLSEQEAENAACLEATGMTPTQFMSEVGALSATSTAVHATHLTDDDIALLGESGTFACFCPSTERELGDGIGPAHELRTAGVRLTLGSDSHAVIDLLEEARLVELHDRLRTHVRGHHNAGDLLRGATADGMASLGVNAGKLRVGYLADFVAVTLVSPRTAGVGDPAAAVVFAATAADVTDVIVGGRHLVVSGEHTKLGDVGQELASVISELT